MSFVGVIVLGLLGVRLLVALVNYLSFPFPAKSGDENGVKDISILIPVRNEEKNIRQLLNSLTRFKHQPLEILVYDDGSTDNTAAIASEFEKSRDNVKVLHGLQLPPGWLGKNHACFQLAKVARGSYFLFLDADVFVKDGLLPRVLKTMNKSSIDLLSIFPNQLMGSMGEKLTVPLMNWILLTLLPLPLVSLSRNPAFAAANGQFMLFRADIYRNMQPHERFRSHPVEDIAISRFYKKNGYSVATLLGDEHIQCRMYAGLNEAVNGFSKNVFHFFGGSVLATILFALITTLTPIVLFWREGVIPGLFALAAIILIRIFVSLSSKQNMLTNISLFIAQHIVFLFLVGYALKSHHKKVLLWKERNILQS